ncbi:MAG TPA: hypothetical protein VK448_06440 [Dissulfurispiraceae bacterium]|nr:hypothetical protein [Dissulfurispiraceae bacterium]
MVKMSHVRSLYSKMLVTCYEFEGKKYVANQHGDFDVFEGEYERDNKVGTLKAQSPEMKNILAEYKKQGR